MPIKGDPRPLAHRLAGDASSEGNDARLETSHGGFEATSGPFSPMGRLSPIVAIWSGEVMRPDEHGQTQGTGRRLRLAAV